MPDLNKVLLMGNLTRDVDLRFLPKGTAVGEIGLAVNSTFKGSDGTTKEEVTFIDIEVWGKQAENAAKFIGKGSTVFVEARLKLESWEKDGKKHYKMKVTGDRIQYLSFKDSGAQRQERPTQNQQDAYKGANNKAFSGEDPMEF